MRKPFHSCVLFLGYGWLCACQTIETQPATAPEASPLGTEAAPINAGATIDGASTAFDYLLQRYDQDGDAVITAAEYTRHDGQLERWDRDGDGQLTREDWTGAASRVGMQIQKMRRKDVLGRYFQTDENGLDVLTIDELANAFFEYDEAGTPDEQLTQDEFESLVDQRKVAMPGDGSMMMQSYVGEPGGWEQLTQLYDTSRDKTLTLEELAVAFESSDVYELHFDRVRFDDGAPGAHFQQLAYEAGLVVGSAVPDVTLSSTVGGDPVDLAQAVGIRPIALIFGSYT